MLMSPDGLLGLHHDYLMFIPSRRTYYRHADLCVKQCTTFDEYDVRFTN